MTVKTMRKTKRKIKQDYLYWLFHQIEERNSSGLEEFISDIDAVEFYCVIPNDDNRMNDGLQLRDRFLDGLDYDPPENALPGPCTVLEMLIALADRMDFILFDSSKGCRRHIWFWLFIDNLKLQRYNSNDSDVERKKKVNKIILKKLVERTYQPNGVGGIFPLNSPAVDQRNVEIWYQMMDYINENYGI